jgi:hypothetical protein
MPVADPLLHALAQDGTCAEASWKVLTPNDTIKAHNQRGAQKPDNNRILTSEEKPDLTRISANSGGTKVFLPFLLGYSQSLRDSRNQLIQENNPHKQAFLGEAGYDRP